MRSKKLSKNKLIITYFSIFLLAVNTLLPDDSFARRGGGGGGRMRGGGGGLSGGAGLSRGSSFGGNGFGSIRHSGGSRSRQQTGDIMDRSSAANRNPGGRDRGIGDQGIGDRGIGDQGIGDRGIGGVGGVGGVPTSTKNELIRQGGMNHRQEDRQDFYEDEMHYGYGHRHWDGYYSGLAFATGIVLGAAIASLPPQHTTVVVTGQTYYYSEGVYYEPKGTTYVVIPPPANAIVSTLPPGGCDTIYVNDKAYSSCGGAFYLNMADGYKVVAPPIGAIVQSLPGKPTKVVANGTTFYTFAGAYYQPFYSGGDVVYKIVKDPTMG